MVIVASNFVVGCLTELSTHLKYEGGLEPLTENGATHSPHLQTHHAVCARKAR